MVSASFSTYYVKSYQVTDFFKGECLEMHEDKKYAGSNLFASAGGKRCDLLPRGERCQKFFGGESKEAVSRLTLI